MKYPKKYIVVKNGEFTVVSQTEAPLNYVLSEPDNYTWTNRHLLIDTSVVVSWEDYYNDSKWKFLEVTYNKTSLFKRNGIKSLQVVIDALNKYKNISKEDLELEYENAGKLEKSDLELELEKLREEKKQVIEETKAYTQILKKGRELFSLIKELEN